jgi:hypothetical protein
MNRGFECLGVSEIDINPKGRGGEVCAQGPPSAVHALPALNRPFSATLGVWGGQRPHACQDAAALRPITQQVAGLCNR